VKLVVGVDEVVRRVDDGHDGRLAGDGDVEGALLEGHDASLLVARALWKEPQLDVLLAHELRRVLQLPARFVRVESVDEDDAGQPGGHSEWPRVQNLLFGHGGDQVRPAPHPEHAEDVERALVVGHRHAATPLSQNVQAADFPPDAHQVRRQAQHIRNAPEIDRDFSFYLLSLIITIKGTYANF